MNLTQEIAEARALAQGLREAAAVCRADQGALKVRLLMAAESLQALALLSVRCVDRVDVLDGALRECLAEMQAWDRLEDRTAATRAAIVRAGRALGVAP